MNRLLIAALLFFISQNILSQNFSKLVYIEKNYFLDDSLYNVYLLYKIPYQKLVFEKENNHYTAGITFSAEIQIGGIIVQREFISESVKVEKYEDTFSPQKSLQGLLQFTLDEGKYTINPSVRIQNMERSFSLPAEVLDLPSPGKFSYSPPLVINNELSCNNATPIAANFGGTIPFSNIDYPMIIFMHGITDTLINYNIIQSNKTIFSGQASLFSNGKPELNKCAEGITLSTDDSSKGNSLFRFEGFSKKLDEGEFTLNFQLQDTTVRIKLETEWINKPVSLRNPEYAIEILEYIDEPRRVNKLLADKEENYYSELKNYWKIYDSDTNTVFNEVMNEFYSRIDYVNEHYSTITVSQGIKTDRGKIYLKFGKPDSVERSYSKENEILEIWNYNKLNHQFVFSDKSGLGNFTLVN